MDENTVKTLSADSTGMLCYEYLVNNVEQNRECLDFLVETIKHADISGQFTASSAIFLAAVDRRGFASAISDLVAATITKDREHKYLTQLAAAIWGSDFADRAEVLSTDDNFRRIYKRLYPEGPL